MSEVESSALMSTPEDQSVDVWFDKFKNYSEENKIILKVEKAFDKETFDNVKDQLMEYLHIYLKGQGVSEQRITQMNDDLYKKLDAEESWIMHLLRRRDDDLSQEQRANSIVPSWQERVNAEYLRTYQQVQPEKQEKLKQIRNISTKSPGSPN